MRAQTEKIARRLNEMHRQVTADPDIELALAHHGSISREVRYDIEARLKAGKIPAVIATASLELGIDIGSIDLVIQLEAPKNISTALQRVGRSGHLLSATSKGRIVVLYPSDLDDAVTIAHCMHRADIEAAHIPENALDVLAQQIVAEVAAKTWNYDELYRLVRQSYCYRNLPATRFKHVIEMLTGRFSEHPLHALKARISWDRVNHRLIARRGSRMVAVLNSGTIPDRGYYGVYLKDSNVRLGEVEEEFVFESRVGETFFLGNSEWRIDSIMQSRIIVTPVAAIKPKAPFWMGDTLFRDYSTSKKIGEFRRKLLDHIDAGTAIDWLTAHYAADSKTALNLVHYTQRQREHLQTLPTANLFVVESTETADGQPVIFIHAPVGARVNGAWAVALAAALERRWQTMIQYSFDDDGIMLRLPDITEPPPVNLLMKLTARDIEENLISALPASPVFAVQFRYNAARSLLLPRSQPNKRIPLWLQRLRAADLLQVVQQYPEFPVIIETFRECLQDVYDLPGLKKIINALQTGRICVHCAQSAYPSPMATNIMFKFVATYLYELDKTRKPDGVATISTGFLAEILDRETIPAIVTPAIIQQAELRWQYLAPEFKAASAEDVFDIIETLGPIDEEQLRRRCREDPVQWLSELKKNRRIQVVRGQPDDAGTPLWTVSNEIRNSGTSSTPANHLQRIRLYLSTRGPVEVKRIQNDLGLSRQAVREVLHILEQQKKAVHGQLIAGRKTVQWCDRQNFMQLYRMAVASRRSGQAPAKRTTFNNFLFEWHRINTPGQSLLECVQRYRGLRLPIHFFERNIIISRFRKPGHTPWKEKLAELEGLIANGEIIVLAGKTKDSGRRSIQFRLRGDGSIFAQREALLAKSEQLGNAAQTVFAFLTENGASYVRDMEMGTGLSRLQLQTALREMADQELVSCENYQSFLAVLQSDYHKRPPHRRIKKPRSHSPFKGPRASQTAIRKMVQEQSRARDGRWFLATSFAVMGKPLDTRQRAAAQARLLLQRYGIVVKEFYRREDGLLSWHAIFQCLKRLEWQGEIRRGYFVDGLSGVQFALPEALELLERIHHRQFTPEAAPVVLNCMDPALPYGGTVDWNMTDAAGTFLNIVRLPGNHLAFLDGQPVLYGEGLFRRLTDTGNLTENDFLNIVGYFSDWLKLPASLRPQNRIEIAQINERRATNSKYCEQLIQIGYAKEGETLTLWPSALQGCFGKVDSAAKVL
jgi:ATP-dependent Lhr-like helicase